MYQTTGPLVPENFEVSRKYFKPPFVCKIFQVKLQMGFLKIFYMVLGTLVYTPLESKKSLAESLPVQCCKLKIYMMKCV